MLSFLLSFITIGFMIFISIVSIIIILFLIKIFIDMIFYKFDGRS